MVRITVLATVLLMMTGCFSQTLQALPPVVNQLKIKSAGYTGCLPDDNAISNLNASADGTGTWNATCKSKVYLCSQGSTGAHVGSYSCAAAVN